MWQTWLNVCSCFGVVWTICVYVCRCEFTAVQNSLSMCQHYSPLLCPLSICISLSLFLSVSLSLRLLFSVSFSFTRKWTQKRNEYSVGQKGHLPFNAHMWMSIQNVMLHPNWLDRWPTSRTVCIFTAFLLFAVMRTWVIVFIDICMYCMLTRVSMVYWYLSCWVLISVSLFLSLSLSYYLSLPLHLRIASS